VIVVLIVVIVHDLALGALRRLDVGSFLALGLGSFLGCGHLAGGVFYRMKLIRKLTLLLITFLV